MGQSSNPIIEYIIFYTFICIGSIILVGFLLWFLYKLESLKLVHKKSGEEMKVRGILIFCFLLSLVTAFISISLFLTVVSNL